MNVFQFAETSDGHFFSQYFFDISNSSSTDIPPRLATKEYEDLVKENTGTFTIKKSKFCLWIFSRGSKTYETS